MTHCSMVSGDIHVWKLLSFFSMNLEKIFRYCSALAVVASLCKSKKSVAAFCAACEADALRCPGDFQFMPQVTDTKLFPGKVLSAQMRWSNVTPHLKECEENTSWSWTKWVLKETLIHGNYISSHRI